jgi:hypothetical protein
MLGIVTAFVLLAEVMVAIAFAHNWQLSWWEWHLLMAIAFGVVVYSARVEAAREGTGDHVFDGLALEETVRRIDEQYDAAVRTLVEELRGRPESGAEPLGELVGRVARRYELGRGQQSVLGRAAGEIDALLVDQAAEAARREQIEQELRLAHLIQQRFLPEGLPQVPGWRVDTAYRPARAVGGDFYDLIELPDGQVGVVVGDVSDKGVPAALVMASIHSILRAEAPRLVAPAKVLERANQLLVAETPVSMFVTCVYAVLDPASGRLRWANAGHDLPLLHTESGITPLHATGMPLGMLPGSSYEEKSTEVPPGGVLLFNSDGITEAHGPGREMFGSARLATLAAGRRGADPSAAGRTPPVHRAGLGAGRRHHPGCSGACRGRSGGPAARRVGPAGDTGRRHPAGGWRHRTGRPGSACPRRGANRHRRSRRHGCR